MKTAERLTKIPPYLFMELRKKINKAKSEGVDVISLAIGDPVEATPDSIIDELCSTARDPLNHRYPTDEVLHSRSERRKGRTRLRLARCSIGSLNGLHRRGQASSERLP